MSPRGRSEVSFSVLTKPIQSGTEQAFYDIDGQLAVPNDLVEQTWPDDFTRVKRDDSCSTVFMTQEVMAAANARPHESRSLRSARQILPGYPRNPAHAATVIR